MAAAAGKCVIFASRPEVSATENEKPADGGLSWCLDLRGIWQPRMDSNHRMPESESGALPLGDGAMELSLTPDGLALGELGGAACLVQADLFALDFAGIAGHETGLAQLGLQRLVVLDQCARDAEADRAGLTGGATTFDGNHHVELVGRL